MPSSVPSMPCCSLVLTCTLMVLKSTSMQRIVSNLQTGQDVTNLSSAKDNKALEYKYKGESYRLWFPDLTNSFGGNLTLLSIKVDLDNGGKDDHVLVLLTYSSTTKQLVMAHATIAIQGADNMNIGTIGYDDGHHPAVVTITSKDEKFIEAPGDTIEKAFQAWIKQKMEKCSKWDDWGNKDTILMRRWRMLWPGWLLEFKGGFLLLFCWCCK